MAKEDHELKASASDLRRLAAAGSNIAGQAKAEFTDFAEEMTDIIEGRRARGVNPLLVIAEAAEDRAGEAQKKAQAIIVKLKELGAGKDKTPASGDPPPDPDPGPPNEC